MKTDQELAREWAKTLRKVGFDEYLSDNVVIFEREEAASELAELLDRLAEGEIEWRALNKAGHVDVQVLVCELRLRAKDTESARTGWGWLYREAADALEAKWAAERGALAEWLYIWNDLPSSEEDDVWWRTCGAKREAWLKQADRLLASSVLEAVRVPTREELIQAVYSGSSDRVSEIESERIADAVLALFDATKL